MGRFGSENDRILRAIRAVSGATDKKGIFAVGIGRDRRNIIIPLLDRELRFAIRQKGDRRVLLPGGKKRSVSRAAQWRRATTERIAEKEREGCRHKKRLRLGVLSVRLPDRPKVPLWLVVIRGLADHPIFLLTNVAPPRDRDHALWIADVHLTRWKCEEAYRFIKQSCNLEDVRVRSCIALRNTYAVADGIHRLLFAAPTGPSEPPTKVSTGQQVFHFLAPPT